MCQTCNRISCQKPFHSNRELECRESPFKQTTPKVPNTMDTLRVRGFENFPLGFMSNLRQRNANVSIVVGP